MTIKEKIINHLQNLPDDVTVDDILEQVILIEKIEIGTDQSNHNQVIPDEDLDQRLGKWLK